jgi:predicted cobalt transporter CbtA
VTGMSDDSTSEVPRQESWSTGDWRTLLITVIGGVAANIGTVLIVGLSLALLHLFQAGPNANPTRGAVEWGLIGFVFITAPGFFLFVSWKRTGKMKLMAALGRVPWIMGRGRGARW